jgi:CRISPR-associated endonuclease Cas3-HD
METQHKYLAHSAQDINGKHFDVQLYSQHICNMLERACDLLDKKKKYINPKIYRVFRKTILLAILYHDLGKLDKQSQLVLHGKSESKMLNHVDAGVAYLQSLCELTQDLSYLIAAYFVLSHHVGPLNFDSVFEEKNDFLRVFIETKQKIRDAKSLSKYDMGEGTVKEHVNLNLSTYVKIHQELIDFGDVFETIEENDAILCIRSPMILKMAMSFLVHEDQSDTASHYGEPNPVRKKNLDAKPKLDNLLKYVDQLQDKYKSGKLIASEDRTRLRNEFFEACGLCDYRNDSFFLINGTVGIGKTLGLVEAALVTAIQNDLDTIIFVLPYIALINQSFEEYIKSLFPGENHKYCVNVIHCLFKCDNLFHRKYQQGFLAPINMTTGVNFFQIISSNHTSIFKHLHSFVGGAICIDEFHTICPEECWPTALLMMIDLSKYFGCKFIFSSGTSVRFWDIPEIQEAMYGKIRQESCKLLYVKDVVPESLYTKMLLMEKERVSHTNSNNEEWDFNRLANEVTKQKQSVFVLFQTRNKAIGFVNVLESTDSRKTYVLCNYLCPKDRKLVFSKIKQSIKDNESIVVIATHGSDTGLDISFFCCYGEERGYDSKLQTGGRVNRGCEYAGSFLHTFKLSDCPNNTSKIFYNNPSLRTKIGVIDEHEELMRSLSPEYCDFAKEKEYECMSEDKKSKMNSLARMWKKRQFSDFSKEFRMINNVTISILINKEMGEKIKNGEFVIPSEIQENIVTIPFTSKNMEMIKDCIVPIEDDLEVEEDEDDLQDSDCKNKSYELSKMYLWTGMYDPEKYGISIDPVFELVDNVKFTQKFIA